MPPVLPRLIWLSTTATKSRRSGPPWKAWWPATRTCAMCRRYYRLRADTVTVAGATHPVSGDLLVQAGRFPGYVYGDRLRVRGQIQTPPVLDDFDYRRYLAQRGIHSLMRRAAVECVAEDQGSPFWALLYGLKARGSASARPSPARTGGRAGQRDAPRHRKRHPRRCGEAFKATGTTHVIVISGSNIALLSGVLMAGSEPGAGQAPGGLSGDRRHHPLRPAGGRRCGCTARRG